MAEDKKKLGLKGILEKEYKCQILLIPKLSVN